MSIISRLDLNLASDGLLPIICTQFSPIIRNLLNLLRSRSSTQNSMVTIELLHNFLQGDLLRLNIVLPDNKDFKSQEDTVHQIILPLNVLDGDRVDILVEPQTEINTEEHQCQTLSTKAVGENLGGVGDQHSAEADVVANVVEEDESNDRVGGVAVGTRCIQLEAGQSNCGSNVA